MVDAGRGNPLSIRRLLSSFQQDRFRWYWTGSALTHTTFRILEVVLGWQILEATDSAFLVGLVAFLYGVPLLLLSPATGLLADRAKRQTVVLAALALAGLAATGLAFLTAAGLATAWHILVASFLAGTAFTLYAPARLALLPNLIPAQSLVNASTLEYSSTRLMGFVGPVVAGLMMTALGTPGTLLFTLLLVLVAGLAFSQAARGVGRPAPRVTSSGRQGAGFGEVFAYLRSDPPLLALVMLCLVIVPFGMVYVKLMPVFVRDVLQAGPSVLGLMVGVASLGSAISGFTIAALNRDFAKGLAVLVSSMAFGSALVAFAFTDQLAAALLMVAVTGIMAGVFLTLSNVLFQSRPPDALRGRVLAMWSMVWGLLPFASILAGAAAEHWQVSTVVAVCGGICVLAGLSMSLRHTPLKQL